MVNETEEEAIYGEHDSWSVPCPHCGELMEKLADVLAPDDGNACAEKCASCGKSVQLMCHVTIVYSASKA